jgi:hypothetical protein
MPSRKTSVYKKGSPIEIGDYVATKDGYYLRSGASMYIWAVVVSLDPFVLVSETFDMLWTKITPDMVYPIKHKADMIVLAGCMERYESFKESYA